MTAYPGQLMRPPFSLAGSTPRQVVRPFYPGGIAPLERGTRRLGLGQQLSYGWLLGPLLLLVYWSIGSPTGFIDSRTLPAPRSRHGILKSYGQRACSTWAARSAALGTRPIACS